MINNQAMPILGVCYNVLIDFWTTQNAILVKKIFPFSALNMAL